MRAIIVAISILFSSTANAVWFDSAKFCLKTPNMQHSLHLQIAKSDEQLAHGLMNRKSLAPYHGMMFNFGTPRVATMWMKDTPLALDMIFLDEQRKILEIARNAVPYTETVIASSKPVTHVIEIEANSAISKHFILGATVASGACLRKPDKPSNTRARASDIPTRNH